MTPKIKTFPLTVTEDWLDKIDKSKNQYESKHDFILKAVENEINKRGRENYDENV